MAYYMVLWTSKEPEQSIDAFISDSLPLPSDVKLEQNWHELGTNRGFALVSSSNPRALHELTVSVMEYLDIQIVPVIGDADAKHALSAGKRAHAKPNPTRP